MLRISLRDGEKMIVNGAVFRAVGHSKFIVENNATVMRGRDVMKPEEANTPARLLYFACMMAYIDPGGSDSARDTIIDLVRELIEALKSPEAKAVCVAFAQKIATSQYYQALSDCRWLMNYEAAAMARPTTAAQ